jgi:hypothetical protein
MEEIRWKMGRKDVSENTGCSHPAESGIRAVFLHIERKQGSGSLESLSFSGASDRL